MTTLICNDTIEYIMKTVDFLLKVKHIRPTREKIYNSIWKELNDELDIEKCKTNIDYLNDSGRVEVRGEGEQESVFIAERTGESSEESGEQTIPETNIQMEIQMAQKEDGNIKIMPGSIGILYERLITNLKPVINFLKNQLLAKDTFFRDEITFLCRQTNEALAKKTDTSAYFSCSTVAFNVDEPPVNGDLANSKPEESAISGDNKKKNT